MFCGFVVLLWMAWESSSLSKIKFSLLVYFCFSLDTNSNNCSVSLDIIFITISSYCFSAFFYVSDFSFFFYLCLSLFVYAYQKLIHLLQWKCFPECTIWNSLVYWKYPHYYSGIFINYCTVISIFSTCLWFHHTYISEGSIFISELLSLKGVWLSH